MGEKGVKADLEGEITWCNFITFTYFMISELSISLYNLMNVGTGPLPYTLWADLLWALLDKSGKRKVTYLEKNEATLLTGYFSYLMVWTLKNHRRWESAKVQVISSCKMHPLPPPKKMFACLQASNLHIHTCSDSELYNTIISMLARPTHSNIWDSVICVVV